MYKNILWGIVAGLIATCVLSVLMLSLEALPRLETVTMLDGIARSLGVKLNLPLPLAGWLWHFVIGTLWWGALFAVMTPILPGRRSWAKGAYFGLGAGFLVMLMVMPMAGAGAFGMQLSPAEPVVTLIEHIIYGVVLGTVYHRLVAFHSSPA